MLTDHSINRSLAELDRLSEREEAIRDRVEREYMEGHMKFIWSAKVGKEETLFDRAIDSSPDPRVWLSDDDCEIYEHGTMDEALVMAARHSKFWEWLHNSAARVVEELINLEVAS